MTETERYAFRFLHTMLRVRNMDRMIAFYTNVLSMSVLRRFEVVPKRETLCFLGYGDENVDTVVELCQEWDRKEPYQVVGQGYGHFALGTPKIDEAFDQFRTRGVTIIQEPKAVRTGRAVIGFIADPEGYEIEVIERT
jgi:lactoylglutathione lyase